MLQEYIEPRRGCITRVEIVDGEFLYALESDTSSGFELCPADVCNLRSDVCPADGQAKFRLSALGADDSLVESYIELCATIGLLVAGIEFVEGAEGVRYTYDINGTTNYNSDVEREGGVCGMDAIARLARRKALEIAGRP